MNKSKTMRITLIVLNIILWFGAIGCYALPYALDTAHENGIAITEQRNLTIDNTYRVVDEQIDDDNYYASEQAEQARYANEFLAKTYKDIDDE